MNEALEKELLNLFAKKQKINSTKTLVKLADDCDVKPSVDYKDFKTLYDFSELCLNKFLLSTLPLTGTPRIPDLLREYQELLPTETMRSVDQSLYQQFSTPLLLAFNMARALPIINTSRILEPSAGTGTLATMAAFFKPQHITVNEVHPIRNQFLRMLPFDAIHKEDAQQICNIPSFNREKFDFVLMNPPFTRNINMRSKVDSCAGSTHISSAVKLMKDQGILLSVIGSSFRIGSKSHKHFISKCPNHKVFFNSILSNETFYKKGTHFETRLIACSNKQLPTNVLENELQNIFCN